MSYEGYVQALCANGHCREWDAYETAPAICSCGEAFVFSHQVDETNCEGVRYPFEVEVPAVTETCNLGHVHVIKEQRFRRPTTGGTT